MDLTTKGVISLKEEHPPSGQVWARNTHQSLHDGVIRGVHVSVEWESAFAITVKRSVPFGCDDPILSQEEKNHLFDLFLPTCCMLTAFFGLFVSPASPSLEN